MASSDRAAVERVRRLGDEVRARLRLDLPVTTVGAGGMPVHTAVGDSAPDVVAVVPPDLSGEALVALLAPVLADDVDVAVAVAADAPGTTLDRLNRFAFGVGDTRVGMVAGRTTAMRPLLDGIAGDAQRVATSLALLARQAGWRVLDVPVPAGRPGPSATRQPLDAPARGQGPPARQPRGAFARWRQLDALARATYAIVTGRARLDGSDTAMTPLPAAAPPAATVLKFVLFGIVGAISGVVYVLVYLPLREVTPPPVANLVALALAALFNIETNRAWTFRRNRVARFGMHVRSAMLFGAHYALTTGAVLVLLAVNPDASRITEVVTLFAADAAMTVARFVGLDKWVFGRGRSVT
ncbi:GtrA family protein [Micromonospora sp. DT229]|uniref:GtrA family protein n=1 Tax=Micromonospora sp. DT229 TaxID=3393430 RepID=UPI003CEBCBB8